MSQLAILGGRPRFPTPVHVGQPNAVDREKLLERINSCLDRQWLTNSGPLVNEFEDRVAGVAGTRYCVATCNGTSALQLAIRSLELAGEVIVPAFTFVATPHAVLWEGLAPVFCDVDPDTHVMTAASVEKLITPRTSAVLGVHLWGMTCDHDALSKLCEQYRLKLIFDAAHAFACSDASGYRVGAGGECEVFSFHATKFLGCGEGGAVVTNSKELAERLRLLRNFGIAGPDHVVSVGTNAKLAELPAALGLTALDGMQEVVDANKSNFFAYCQAMSNCKGISVFTPPTDHEWNHQYVVARVGSDSPLTRDELMKVLHVENVLARRYFFPGCHRMGPYSAGSGTRDFPITDLLSAEVLVLPTGTNMSVIDIAEIGQIVLGAQEQADEIRPLVAHLLPTRFDWLGGDE